ncbi:hypothetical protein [Salsuginibacillus kocurii]|uniref:hypothetical protein n=1 Tax=Salsuginibacillus kocurii TaxID=427078 RepID=UPI00036D8022|nr:hypothetical protein [Salsuginibacillus kocurii]
MTKSSKGELAELLATLGLKSEDYLNTYIKNLLNHPIIVERTNARLETHAERLKTLQHYTEILAQQLNVPTKQDVANVAKLARQIEEKLDELEERLLILTEEENGKFHEKPEGPRLVKDEAKPRYNRSKLDQNSARKLLQEKHSHDNGDPQALQEALHHLRNRRQ